MTDRLLRIKDVQDEKLLPIGQTSLYKLFNSRSFPSFRIGSCLMVKESDLNLWINKQKIAKY